MKSITNLYDLRGATSEKTVELIVTQYMMETIARGNILRLFEKDLYSMNDEYSLSVADIKDRLLKYESDFVNNDETGME